MLYKQTPVKITGYGLAAGCQVFYRKIYGFFYSVQAVYKTLVEANKMILGTLARLWHTAISEPIRDNKHDIISCVQGYESFNLCLVVSMYFFH